jgi:hypothetical protein
MKTGLRNKEDYENMKKNIQGKINKTIYYTFNER